LFSPGAFGDAFIIEAQVEAVKFANAMKYLNDAIKYALFTNEKIKTATQILLNKIQEIKRRASSVVRFLYDTIYFGNDCNIFYTSFIRQQVFLRDILKTNLSNQHTM